MAKLRCHKVDGVAVQRRYVGRDVRARCDLTILNTPIYTSTDWTRVTCLNCLKKKEKMA